jgi:signal transduction histidine kinase
MLAEADVREYLLGARTVFSAEMPFFPALRLYIERFNRQNHLPVELVVPVELEGQDLAPSLQVQASRIIQEALSNIRKHAHADKARIEFSVLGTLLGIDISDDGQGFDPIEVAAQNREGYGLRGMRERAAELGGRLDVISQPGDGTRVEVRLPLDLMVKLPKGVEVGT